MNIEQYIAAMDPELRSGFQQIRAIFSNIPSDPEAAVSIRAAKEYTEALKRGLWI